MTAEILTLSLYLVSLSPKNRMTLCAQITQTYQLVYDWSLLYRPIYRGFAAEYL